MVSLSNHAKEFFRSVLRLVVRANLQRDKSVSLLDLRDLLNPQRFTASLRFMVTSFYEGV